MTVRYDMSVCCAPDVAERSFRIAFIVGFLTFRGNHIGPLLGRAGQSVSSVVVRDRRLLQGNSKSYRIGPWSPRNTIFMVTNE